MTKETDAAEAAERRLDARLTSIMEVAADRMGRPLDDHVKVVVMDVLIALADALGAESQEIIDARKKSWQSMAANVKSAGAHVTRYQLSMVRLAVPDAAGAAAVEARVAAIAEQVAARGPVQFNPGPLTGMAVGDFPETQLDRIAAGLVATDAATLGAAIIGAADALADDPFNDPHVVGVPMIDSDPFIEPGRLVDGETFIFGSEPVAEQPTSVPAMDGGLPVAALYIGPTVTPPMPSYAVNDTVAGVDPFSDPAGRNNMTRLTWAQYEAAVLQLEPSEHMSNSKLEQLGKCGVAYALDRTGRRGLTPAQRPQWATIGGTAFHSAVRALEEITVVTGEAATDIEPDWWVWHLDNALDVALSEHEGKYTEHDVRASKKGLEGRDWWRVEGQRMVRRYLAYHDAAWRQNNRLVMLGQTGPDTPPLPATEVEFHLDFGRPGVPVIVHGFIDSLWYSRPAAGAPVTVRLVDWKSGSTEGSMLQRAGYTWAAIRSLGIVGPILSANWDAREAGYTPWVDATLVHPWEKMVTLYSVASTMDKANLFLPNPTPWCNGCSHEAYCPTRAWV